MNHRIVVTSFANVIMQLAFIVPPVINMCVSEFKTVFDGSIIGMALPLDDQIFSNVLRYFYDRFRLDKRTM